MTASNTNLPGGVIPPRPEAPAVTPEQSLPSSQGPASGETRRPALVVENLDLLEAHAEADTIAVDQAATVAAMFAFLTPDKFSVKEGTLKTIADRAQERLAADGADLQGLTVHHALEEFHTYLQAGGETKVVANLQTLPEKYRAPLEQELLALLLRGHVSGEVLALILGGGFRLAEAGADHHPDLGIPLASFHAVADKLPGFVDIYAQNLPEQFDIRFLSLHALAHALILAPVKGGLIYRIEDLANLLAIALATPTGANPGELSADDRPFPLETKETLILHRAMGDGNRATVKPFESPLVAGLLEALDKNPTPELRPITLNEMLAERLAAYLASDGSLADFLHQRLIHASAVQAATGTIDPTHPAAKLAQELELLKIQAREERWSYEMLVPKLQDFSRRLPGLADFLAETIFLDRRFSRALRGPDNLPLSLATNKYRLTLLAKLKGQQLNVHLPTITDVYRQNRLEPVMVERVPLGQPLPSRPGKSFWQVLAEAFSAFMRALGLDF